MKIAIAGIATESCTFRPCRQPSRISTSFKLFCERYPSLSDYPETEFVGTVVAKALPSGSVEPDAYDTIKDDMLNLLRANVPFDGVYLDMHGTMNVQGRD